MPVIVEGSLGLIHFSLSVCGLNNIIALVTYSVLFFYYCIDLNCANFKFRKIILMKVMLYEASMGVQHNCISVNNYTIHNHILKAFFFALVNSSVCDMDQ